MKNCLLLVLALAACGDSNAECDVYGIYELSLNEIAALSGGGCGPVDTVDTAGIGLDLNVQEFANNPDCGGRLLVDHRACRIEWNLECFYSDGAVETRAGSATADLSMSSDVFVGEEIYTLVESDGECSSRYQVVYDRI